MVRVLLASSSCLMVEAMFLRLWCSLGMFLLYLKLFLSYLSLNECDLKRRLSAWKSWKLKIWLKLKVG